MDHTIKPVIMPVDGTKSAAHLISKLTMIMISPGMSELVGTVKINDGNFKHDMSAPNLGQGLQAVAEETGTKFGTFEDLKTGDVSESLKNISTCFRDVLPEILTASAIIATKGFLEIRKALPTTKVALFSVPTDMGIEECKKKYNGMTPAEKIVFDIYFFMEQWERVLQENDIEQAGIYKLPFDMVVCSPRELDYLNSKGLDMIFKWICPGIRDSWMAKDHQERTTGILEALQKGAGKVVMGTQLLKGNPKKGISAEESRQRTIEEVKKFYQNK